MAVDRGLDMSRCPMLHKCTSNPTHSGWMTMPHVAEVKTPVDSWVWAPRDQMRPGERSKFFAG